MKATKKMLSLIGAAAMAGTASAVNVTIDKVQQRYPWNGLVDIDYELDGGVSVDTQFQITVTANGKTYTASTFKDAVKRTRGKHRITWDTAADNAKFFSKNATVKMSLVDTTGTYYIFDLVNGGAPVITNCTSEAFSDNVYKTTKLVMRKVDGQTYHFKNYGANHNYGYRAEGDVTVDSFLVGIYEVTQAQWKNIMGEYPNCNFKNEAYRDYLPCEMITYNQIRGEQYDDNGETKSVDWPTTGSNVAATSLLGLLRTKINNSLTTGYLFDLPTDKQWQCAYRAGTTTMYYDGLDSAADATAWAKTMGVIGRCAVNNTAAEATARGMAGVTGTAMVGTYAANGYGLYDMSGNVWEMVLNKGGTVAVDEELTTPANASVARFVMGGSWFSGASYASGFSAGSSGSWGESRSGSAVGFRLFSSL